jgi:hypothetical protein
VTIKAERVSLPINHSIGELWIIAWDFLVEFVQDMMSLTPYKLPNYQRGIRAMKKIKIS